MNQDLVIKFWWGDANTMQHIQRTLAAFEAWLGKGMHWSTAKMYRQMTSQDGMSLNSTFTTTQFLDWIADDLRECKVVAQGAIPTWTIGPEGPVMGFTPIAFSFWGPAFGKLAGLDQQLQGHGELYLFKSMPYFARGTLATGNDPETAIPAAIAKNLEQLLALLQTISQRSHLQKWLAFSNSGSADIPLNAHAGWWAKPALLIDTLREQLRILIDGRRADRLPPMAVLEDLQGTGYRHPWRTTADTADLLKRLQDVAANGHVPHLIDLEALIDVEAHGLGALHGGIAVIHPPYYLNALLDRPLLDLLGATEILEV